MGAFSAPPAADGRIWAVDCYVRASREDGGTAQSETITNPSLRKFGQFWFKIPSTAACPPA